MSFLLSFREIQFGTPEYDESVRLRYDVLRKPLDLEFEPEDLALEWNQIHLGAYLANGLLAASLILAPAPEKGENTLKMRQVATRADLQGKGIGTELVLFSEKYARAMDCSLFYLHAREAAVDFYKKMNYQTVGDRFLEVGIPHFALKKQL